MTERVTGQIVRITFENGAEGFDCGLEDCECPQHEFEAMPTGTYLTVRLDKEHADFRAGFWNVTIETKEATDV